MLLTSGPTATHMWIYEKNNNGFSLEDANRPTLASFTNTPTEDTEIHTYCKETHSRQADATNKHYAER